MGRAKLASEKLSTFYTEALDWKIYRAGQVPGPGDYDSNKTKLPQGGTFSKFTPKGYCDDSIKKAKSMPGPADYAPPKKKMPSGGKFNMSKPKGEIDWIIYRASQIPGPADGNIPVTPKPSGGKFNMSNAKSDVEWNIYRAGQIPGPADYGAPKLPPPSGGKFNASKPKGEIDWLMHKAKGLPGPGEYDVTKRISSGGGRFNLSNPKSDIEWKMYNASQMPGPGSYDVDGSLKKLQHSPSPSLMGRTGPRSMPWPFNGKKKREKLDVSATSPVPKEIPPEARGKVRRSSSTTPSRRPNTDSTFLTTPEATRTPSKRSVSSVTKLPSTDEKPSRGLSNSSTKPKMQRSKNPGPVRHGPKVSPQRRPRAKTSAGYHPLAEDPAPPVHRNRMATTQGASP